MVGTSDEVSLEDVLRDVNRNERDAETDPSVGSDAPGPSRGLGRQGAGMRVFGVVRAGVLTAAAALGVLCILVFGVSLAFGVKPLVVLSGSMEPTIPVGSVVFARTVSASEIAPGDIVTTDRSRNLGLVTHRVVSIHATANGAYEMVLRGDANSVDDAEPYQVTAVGRYVAHVPMVGYVAMGLRTTQGLALGVSALLLVMMFFVLDPARLSGK